MPAVSKKMGLWDDVVRLSETMSQVEVGKALDVHPVTIAKWCREEGFDWPRSTGGRPKVGRIIKPCRQCGKEMNLTRYEAETRGFCSRDCTNEWQRGLAGSMEVTCPCGKIFSVRPSERGRQFCSKKCAGLYQTRRQRDRSKWVTKVCQNEACGKDFEIRTSSRSAGMFCSNACAQRHTRTKVHVVMDDDGVVLDSKWEALFWGLMGFLKIPCLRYDRQRAVEWTPGQWYAPDFYLPDYRLAVEVKGQVDAQDPRRWAAFRREIGPLMIIRDHTLEYLRTRSAEEARDTFELLEWVDDVCAGRPVVS